MPKPLKGRVDKLAPDRITTEVMIDELKSKIQLAEHEHKAMFEKSEQEKKINFATLLSERKRNKLRLHGHNSTPDSHNIAYAFDKKQPIEKRFMTRKTMTEALQIQDYKVCEAIKKYNLKVYEKEQKMEQVKKLMGELELMKSLSKRKKHEEMSAPEEQNIRVLQNRLEKLKMKYSSAQLIARNYHKITDSLKEDTQNYPWKLDELECELIQHQKTLEDAVAVNREAESLKEKSIQSTKKFHEEYFESKKSRDKMLAATRKDVDKTHKEVKGIDKPKAVRGIVTVSPMQDIINKEAEDAHVTHQKYEQQRKKRIDYEGTASFLKNACKVSTKEEILPAITQQHEVQRALRLQIASLEDQKSVLEMEKKGISKEYQKLKYYGEKRVSEGMMKLEKESEEVERLRRQLHNTTTEIQTKENLLKEVNMASNNFFMILQKYKIDPEARKLMTGQFENDLAILTEKMEKLAEQIAPHGKVVDFLTKADFLDFMEDTLPKANTRVDVRGEEEEGGDVFEDETAKTHAVILGREEIKKASQKIIEKNQGKQRRKKMK